MKTCPNCNQSVEDGVAFCTNCGVRMAEPEQQQPQQPPQNAGGANQNPQGESAAYQAPPVWAAPPVSPYDHTAEFDAKDISDNKVMAMALYLMGIVGIFIALLAAPQSPYVAFHLRQAMKFSISTILMSICTILLCWTFIVPIAYTVMLLVLFVIKMVCFFQVCSGKAVEPAIIRSLPFLK